MKKDRKFDENFTSWFHEKVFTSTWCHEILGFFRCSEISWFFSFSRFSTNGVMQLEFIVIVTIINLLRRLKTSNENHKFPSEGSRAFLFPPSILGLKRNDLFSFDHQSEFFSAFFHDTDIKIARFKSNIFLSLWLNRKRLLKFFCLSFFVSVHRSQHCYAWLQL